MRSILATALLSTVPACATLSVPPQPTSASKEFSAPAADLVRASTNALATAKYSVAYSRHGLVETNCLDIRDAQPLNPNPEMSDLSLVVANTCRKYVITVTPAPSGKSIVRIEPHMMYLNNDIIEKRWNDEVEQANWNFLFQKIRNDL